MATPSIAGCLGDEPVPGSEEDGGNGAGDVGGVGRDGRDVVEEDPRVDEPPHAIERPDGYEDADEWDEEYLSEGMETEPSLEFDRIRIRRSAVADSIGPTEHHVETYRVRSITDEDDATVDEGELDDDGRDRLRTVDFDESTLVIVESGSGSGSVEHRWARAEDDGAAIHLHGYYTDPWEHTDDDVMRQSVLAVERSRDDVGLARVSLTVDEERRVHVNSTEGVVELEDRSRVRKT